MKKEAIEYYLRNGYTLFPVKGKSNPPKGWQKIKANPFQDDSDFPNNFGICLQDDDLIIDIDVGEKIKSDGTKIIKKGKESFNKLVQDIGYDFQNTFAVKTGGGGLHFYLKKPKDLPIKEKQQDYPDIEFKSKGRYVVGAGSIHPETKNLYKIIPGRNGHIQEAPTTLLHIIKKEEKDSIKSLLGLKQYVDDVQTINRLENMLKTAPPAIEGMGGDLHTYKIMCACRAYGVSPETVLDKVLCFWNPKCDPPWDEEDIKQKIVNAYSYDSEPLGTRSPDFDFKEVKVDNKNINNLKWTGQMNRTTKLYKPTLRNMSNYMFLNQNLRDLFSFNLFSKDIEFTRRPVWYPPNEPLTVWTDTDAIQVKLLMEEQQGLELKVHLIHEATYIKAMEKPIHPLRDYLQALVWDKKPRIDGWLSEYAYVDDNVYTRDIGTKVLLAAVGRVLNPGCSFHSVLILEGEQGVGKSYLVSQMGMEWYGDLTIDPHKIPDTVDAMRKKWIIELAEMEIARKDVAAVRRFLSASEDRTRLAYRKNSEDFPRQSIFIGTFNPDKSGGYLNDTTGNRRFWPVHVNIKLVDGVPEKLIRVHEFVKDRDQMYAEAVYRYTRGETDLRITDPQTLIFAAKEVEKRRPKDSWLHVVEKWLDQNWEDGTVKKGVTGIEVYLDALDGSKARYGRAEGNRITQILEGELGWKKGNYYSSKLNKTIYGFIKPQSDIDLL